MNVACPLKFRKAEVPSHFDCRLVPCWPPVTQISLKAVLSKSNAAASVMSASPSPRSRRDRRASATATMAAKDAADQPPQQEVQPEMGREDGGGETADTGERRLAQRQLAGHAGDQRDG